MKSFRLAEAEARALLSRFRTPFLVVSLTTVEENYRFLRQHLPRARVCYAMKANSTPEILQRLAALGSDFDVASAGEMQTLHELGVEGARMVYANTVKDLRGLETAQRLRVRRLTFDDISEVPKMARHVPGAGVLLRIRVRNSRALVDLNSKFGAEPEDALDLLRAAADAGLVPLGLCFHVGSQSAGPSAYEEALRVCRGLFDAAAGQGMRLTDLDIGGGFPIPTANGEPRDAAQGPQPSPSEGQRPFPGESQSPFPSEGQRPFPSTMLEVINGQLNSLFPDTTVWCEPGRFLCGTAVNLLASVIGTKERDGRPWYILDEGIYGAFSGILFDHWTYPITAFASG